MNVAAHIKDELDQVRGELGGAAHDSAVGRALLQLVQRIEARLQRAVGEADEEAAALTAGDQDPAAPAKATK